MQAGWRGKAAYGVVLGVFLTGAALENGFNFLNALGRGITAVSRSPHTPAVIAGLLALAAGFFLARLAVLRIIAFHRWRVLCRGPRYVAPIRRPIAGAAARNRSTSGGSTSKT